MADYDNTNRGALFKNDKATTDKHPGYTGKINVEGVEYYLSAWVKEGQKGKFFSLSVKPVDEQQKPASGGIAKKAPTSVADMESDIPFSRLSSRYDA